MKSLKSTIQIIARGKKDFHSFAKIEMNKCGDIYIATKFESSDFHFSRHKDGNCHCKMFGEKLFVFESRAPIDVFNGIELLGTWAFGLNSFPEISEEFRIKKCNGIVTIDMRYFEGLPFNLGIAILTETGIPYLMNMCKNFQNRQIYIYANPGPMIGIFLCAAEK